LSASRPPATVLRNAAAAMTSSSTSDSFHAFRPTGYIAHHKIDSLGAA
jgi:hypothetical protein